MSRPANTVEEILRGTGDADKTYTFDEKHNPSLPINLWFQESNEGMILFVVFYTQACRWSRCLSCNLPSACSKFKVGYKEIRQQVDWVFAHQDVIRWREKIRKVIISNNGSVLDQETFSSNALMYLTLMANENFPNLKVLSIETRTEYVEPSELEFLSRAIKEGSTETELELAVGFEAFDDHIRNGVLKKGLPKSAFEKFVAMLAPYGFRVKAYVMQKPVPGVSDQESSMDIKLCIEYFVSLSRKYTDPEKGLRTRIDMHINPTYVSAGTPLEKAFHQGKYSPPHLRHVAEAILSAEGLPISIFVGLSDEGLSVPNGSFLRPGDEPIRVELERFNVLQDYDILRAVLAK